jgi:hypothetical protein
LDRLVKRPLGGLVELIWNAIDADASTIEVRMIRNVLDGIDAIEVIDDGTGITVERAELSFGRLGGSWKASTSASEDGRPLHGRAGQGRIAAFGIGESVSWRSTAIAIDGNPATIEIIGNRGSLNEVDITAASPSGRHTGTSVRIDALTDAAAKWFESDAVIESLTATFALAIEMHQIEIQVGGRVLDPQSIQKSRVEYELSVEGLKSEQPVNLLIIEWNKPQKNRALLLCDGNGTALHETKAGIRAPGFHFTAYLKWEGFSELQDYLALADLGSEPVSTVVEAGKEKLREHFEERRKSRGAELMAAWKAEHTYPYKHAAANPLEKAERELFEIVAVAASPAIEGADLKSRKLSLRLIREALENNPSGLQEVLHDVIDLPEEQIAELAGLLKKTSISSMIEATRQVTDRLDFLVALEQMIWGPELRQKLKERSQLHRILANETWVFKEEYALTADDVSLTTALRDYVKELGREALAPVDLEDEVTDVEGRRAVVDVMLSRVIEQHENRRQHIVVELKRPTVHIGAEQLMQISKYASAVSGDGRFAMTDTSWEFWIVGDEIGESAKLMLGQDNRDPGTFVAKGNIVIRAVTWAKLIQDARHRLSFIKKSFSYSPSDESARGYLNSTYERYLPGFGVDVVPDPDEEDVLLDPTQAPVPA